MTGISSQAKVGIFVVIAALILAYMSIRVEDLDMKSGGYRLSAVFDAVSGLEEAAQVKVAGVPVGKVEKIELVDSKARITIYVTPDVVLRKDSVIAIRSMGLLGEKYVEITPGSPDAPRLKNNDTIRRVKVSTDFDELTTTLGDIAKDITSVTASIKGVLGTEKGQEKMRRILDNAGDISDDVKAVIKENRENLQQTIKHLRRLSANLDKLIAQNRTEFDKTAKNVSKIAQQLSDIIKTNREQLERTIANLEDVSKTLKGESPRLAKNANRTMEQVQEILQENRDDLKNSMAKIREAAEKLDKTLASANKITESVERGEGTLGKLFKDESAYNNLNDGLKGLKGFFEKGKDLQVFVGVRSEHMFRQEDAKTYITLKLQPKSDKYYLVEMIDDPRGRTDTTTTKRTTTTAGGTDTVTEKEEVNEDELKFSVQVAKRFYQFTVRGGLIESTGGVALDYEPLGEERLKFSFEAWDLGADKPHLKLTGNFYVYERIFLNAGVDDIMDGKYRTFFAGAGLLFNDDDLKSLLGGMAMGAGTLGN